MLDYHIVKFKPDEAHSENLGKYEPRFRVVSAADESVVLDDNKGFGFTDVSDAYRAHMRAHNEFGPYGRHVEKMRAYCNSHRGFHAVMTGYIFRLTKEGDVAGPDNIASDSDVQDCMAVTGLDADEVLRYFYVG